MRAMPNGRSIRECGTRRAARADALCARARRVAMMSGAHAMSDTPSIACRARCGVRCDARCVAHCFELRVKNFEHSSIDRADFSCGPKCLRVKSDLKFGCSISRSNKRRSITELNSDSHSSKFIVKHSRRQPSRTLRSCGSAPSSESLLSLPARQALRASKVSQICSSSGASPDFPSADAAVPSDAACRLSSQRAPFAARSSCGGALACAPHRAEFISVSGFCADRSALRSDLRLKRTSGPVAATVLPRAPMNGPGASHRVSFS